jgi:hypothetical protein
MPIQTETKHPTIDVEILFEMEKVLHLRLPKPVCPVLSPLNLPGRGDFGDYNK